MTTAFQYRPRFVDIRVRPPPRGADPDAPETGLKPGERACDHPGCKAPGVARAPKSREMLEEHYWFCQPHADVDEPGSILKGRGHCPKYATERLPIKN